jgi:hypothetical protein
MVQFLRTRVLLLLVGSLFFANYSLAQVATKYNFSQASGAYAPITSGTAVATASVSSSLDDEIYTLPSGTIPFNFRFDGANYTGLTINSNGYITFGATLPSATTYTGISSPTAYNGAIAAASVNLNALFIAGFDTGSISYETRGVTPNREFVIQYKNFRPYTTSTSVTDYWRWNFQIILKEDNSINLVYDLGFVGAPANGTGSPQVGLRGPSNDFATNVNNRRINTGTHTWTTSVKGATNASTCNYSTSLLPPSGHTYIFAPLNNLLVKSLVSPAGAGCYSASETVIVRVVNAGNDAADLSQLPLSVSATVSGGVSQSLSSTITTGVIAANDSLDVNLGTMNLLAGGNLNFVLAATRSGDQVVADDTLRVTRTAVLSGSLPLSVDFTGYDGDNLSSLFPLWREGYGLTTPDEDTISYYWESYTGMGGATNTTAKLNLYYNDASEWIVGPAFTAGTDDTLSLDVAVSDWEDDSSPDAMGSDDKVYVKLNLNCGATWVAIDSFTAADNLQNSLTKFKYSLAAYAGQKVIVAIHATDGTVNDSEDYDFHIDNIFIFSAGADIISPVVAAPVNSPAGNQCSSGSRTVTVSVTDAGGVQGVTLTPSFNGVAQTAISLTLTSGTAENGTWSGTIPAAGDSVLVTYTIAAKDSGNNIATVPGTTYKDGNFLSINAGADQTVSQGSTATLKAVTNINTSTFRITEVTQYKTGTGATPTYPAYVTGEDLIEITNLGTQPEALDSFKFFVEGTSTTRNLTFPAGVTVPAGGVVVVHIGSGTNSISNLYFNTGGSNDAISSGTQNGYYLVSKGGAVIDAVASDGYTFSLGSGVSASDWSGTLGSSSSLAGLTRTAAVDNNSAADWSLSSAVVQSVGTINSGLGTITPTVPVITWNPGAVVANPYITPVFNTQGSFTFVASVTAGCTATDTVIVNVIAAAVPEAGFTVSSDTVSTLDVVTLTDTTKNLPTSWAWSFSPGTVTYENGTNATSQNPQVIFTTPGTYTVQLIATNNSGSDTATFTFVSVSQGYCVPVSGTINAVDIITKVVITNYNASDSLVQTSTSNTVDNYDVYTADTVDITKTTTSTLAVTFGTDGTQYGAAWIDYNNNGLFEASESIWVASASTGGSGTATVAFIVPSNAPLGTVRLRIRGGNDNAYTSADGCGSKAYGEAEDYIINIIAPPSCVNPPVAGTVGGNSDACAGQPLTLTLTGNTVGTAVQWQTSADSILWTDVAGEINGIFIDTAFSATQYYRAKVTCTDSVFTAGLKVTVKAIVDCYCQPTADCTDEDDIDGLVFGSINNTTSACGDLVTGYILYPESQYTTTVFASNAGYTSTYNIDVTTGPDFTFGNGLGAWIDFNHNGSFDDAGEFFLITNGAFESETYSASITIPATADTGKTILRVRTYYGNDIDSSMSCTAFSYGETEDYVISITEAPVCTTPADPGVVSGPVTAPAYSQGLYVATGANGDSYQWQFALNPPTFFTLTGTNNDSLSVALNVADTVFVRIIASRPGCPDSASALFQTIITLAGNDVCNAIPISFGANGPYNNFAATAQTGEVSPPATGLSTQTGWGSGSTLTNTMWFSFVAPPSGRVVVQSPDFDTQLALWSAGSCSDLLSSATATLIAANDDDAGYASHNGEEYSSFIDTVKCLVPGKTYYVQLDAYDVAGDTTRIILTDGGFTSEFSGLATAYCSNSTAVTLVPQRAGGTFGGSGVSGTTFTPSSLAPGTYQVYYAHNCDTTFKTVVINTPPSVTVTSTTNVLCFSNASGAIDVAVSGGATPYTSSWSNGATTEDLTNVVAGTYTDTVSDANGCKAILAPVTITQPATGLSVALDSVVNASCNGGSNGAVYVTVTGVTGSAVYTWNGVAGTEDHTSLTAGTYTLVVSDGSSCTSTGGPYTVGQATLLVTTVDSIDTITCNGAANGAIYTTTTGGTTPYTYLWSNTAPTEDITGLTANNYVLAVTDAKGCTTSVSRNLTEPLPLTITVDSSKNVNCFGDASGAVYTTAAGGTTPYTYIWTNSAAVTGDITGLTPNTYTVTATDAHGCTVVSTAKTVTGPSAALSTILDSTHNVKCNGGTTGAAYTTTTGGTSPYTFLWSNSASVEDISNLGAGTVTLVATDNKGCKDTVTATITAPAALSVSTVSTNQIGSTPGSVTTTVTGGTPAYTYAWTPGGAVTPNLASVNAGIYTVIVTDANGCTATAKDTVDFINGVSNVNNVNVLRMYPNPTSGSAVIEVSLVNAQDIKLEILDVTGRLVETRTERNVTNAKLPINITGEAAGSYLIRIHTAEGMITKSLVLQK